MLYLTSRPGPECNIFHTVDARYNNWFIVLLLLVDTTTVGTRFTLIFDELFCEDAQAVRGDQTSKNYEMLALACSMALIESIDHLKLTFKITVCPISKPS